MKKRVLSMLLIMAMLIGVLVPLQAVAAEGGAIQNAVDTSWYDASAASGTVFEIADAADLRGAAKLSREGVTFSGYTLKLTADIDLNPGWNGKTTITDGKATLPEIPAVEFEGFDVFKGTFDGNGKTVAGIYMYQRVDNTNANLAIFRFVKGGTIKNLIIKNSFIFADMEEGRTDLKIAGLIARVQDSAATLDTLYLDLEVWYRSWSYERIGGVISKTDSAAATIKNVAFVGTVGNMTPSNAVPSTSDGVYISQFIADANYKTGNKYENIALNGTEYAKDGRTGKIIASNDKDEVSKATVAFNTTIPATVQAMLDASTYNATLEAFNIWPSGVTADSKTASYNSNKSAYVKYYSKATNAQYTSYLSTLSSNGYTKSAEYTIGDNSYALYEKAGAYSVYVSYLGYKPSTWGGSARMRVFVEPYGSAYNLNATATTASVCSSKIWQLDVDNTSGENGGMSYVIRLTDGTFIVIDGGYATAKEAQNLYSVLSNNNPNGGNPVIRAWFITHTHNDHGGVLANFAATYASNVTVEGFYYNFPGNDVVGDDNTDTVTVSGVYAIERYMSRFAGAIRYRKLHSGMTIGFAGVSATILGTHEDVCQSYYDGMTLEKNTFQDGNDTSTVIKFTVGTQTFMVLGDARMHMSDQLLATYPASVLKSDIVQFSHHGYTGARDELYEKIDADVVLWPMDVVNYSKASEGSYSTLFKNYYNNDSISANDYVRKNAVEVIPSYETVCLTMPYAAKTYSKGQKIIDLDAAYTNKVYAANVDTFAVDTSWYDANASTYYLYDAGDLLGFAKLGKDGNNFIGKTIMLMNDIDLNPGWNATVTIGDKVNFPVAPVNVWSDIDLFKGTLDGNGYTISGLYKIRSTKGESYNGGLFNKLEDGTIKNLAIVNSFFATDTTGATFGGQNFRIGGLLGTVQGSGADYKATVSNVYVDMEVWAKHNYHASVGGVFGKIEKRFNLNNVTFAGRVGTTSTEMAVNFDPSGDTCVGQIAGKFGWKSITAYDLMAIGTIYSGESTTAYLQAYCGGKDGLSVTRGLNSKQDASYLDSNSDYKNNGWAYSNVLGAIAPGAVAGMVDGTYAHAAVDNKSAFGSSLNDENTYYIYTAAELLDTIKNGGTFEGKTVMLMNDIDLNPGWSAAVTIDDKVNFPSAPTNVWPVISEFKGTLDGNGHTLSGVYSSVSKSATSASGYAGMITTMNGGKIKNIAITNSFVLTKNTAGWGTLTVGVGAIVGEIKGGARIENFYTDVEMWHQFAYHQSVGGIIGYVGTSNVYSMENIVFAGRVGQTDSNNTANYVPASTSYLGQIIGNENWKAATLKNALCIGEFHGTNKKTSTTYAGTNDGADKLVKTNAFTAKTELNDTLTAAGWTYNAELGSAVPANVGAILDGTYGSVSDLKDLLDTPEMLYQVSDVVDGKYNIRFVSGINQINYSNKVGFDITLIVGGTEYKLDNAYTTTDTVYESILADGTPVSAESLGYDYLYSQEITNIPATEKITIKIAAVNVDTAGNTIVGSAMTFQFHYGNGYVTAR